MKKEYIYASISILLWSTTATVTKLLLGGLNSVQILVFSSLFAFVFLLVVNIIKGNIIQLKSYKIKDFTQIFIMGILGVFLYYLFLYMGTDILHASQAFIINYLWPIMTVVFACIFLKEKVTLRKIIAIIISFVGVVIVTANGNLFNINNNTLIGAIYCILAAVAYGIFNVFNKKKDYNKYLSMMLFYFTSFLVSSVYVLFFDNEFIIDSNQIIGLLWIGIFTSATAFTSWSLALKYGDTVKISNLAYITPFLSLIWTSLILREKITIYYIIGLIIIISGIFIQLKYNEKNKEKINGRKRFNKR